MTNEQLAVLLESIADKVSAVAYDIKQHIIDGDKVKLFIGHKDLNTGRSEKILYDTTDEYVAVKKVRDVAAWIKEKADDLARTRGA